MSNSRRALSAVVALLVSLLWLPMLAGSAWADNVTLEPDLTINGCNGVLITPGSENTTKRLDPDFPSDFDPGGVVGYLIDFPATPDEADETFEITDCVYMADPGSDADDPGDPIAKYFVHFVPNDVQFQLQFSIDIPEDAPLGAKICNYAKTTANPSAPQASNRKAGPACFTVGGGLRVEKRSGSETGPLLAGASFTVVCEPDEALPPTIITGLSNQSQTNNDGTVSASGVAATGAIAINGPSGTPCTVTETAAPPGYLLDATPRELTIPVGTSQTVEVFVNEQLGSLSISKTTVGGAGTFTFNVTCDDGHNFANITMTVAADDTATELVSDELLVGTTCTVTETPHGQFSTVRTPANGQVTIDADGETVSFTNTRLRGDLVVDKVADVDGTFHFDVDCDDDTFDTTLHITTSGGTGSAGVDGIPTGVECTVSEQTHSDYSFVVVPADGTVTITTGDNTVTFTNTRLRGDLVVDKAADVDGTFTFDVDCTDDAYDASNLSITTVNGTGSASVDGIPTGVECTVTEDSDPLWTVQVVPADGTVTIAVGDNTVAFENTRKRGDLVIQKASDVDGTFTFDVDCTDDAYDASNVSITTVNGVGSASIDDIPTGVECTVTEDADAAWTHVVVPADGTVTVDVGDNTVAFTNTRVRGDLLITKTTDEDGTFTFDVDCTDDAYDASNLSITTVNGVGSASVDGIPSGVTCVVTEDAHPLFDTTVVPSNGTVVIDDDGEEVAFDNLRKRGSLVVTKTVVDATASGPYDFLYHVTCGEEQLADFHLGTAGALALTHQIDGIPTGTECTVTEEHDSSWAMTVSPADASATIGATPVTVAFTNTKLYTDVTFAKSSVPASGAAVTDGDTITYTVSYANAGNIAANVTITDAIPAGTTYVNGSATGGGTLANGELSWDVTIAAAGAGSVSFAVTVNAGLADPFTIRNVAVLHEGEEETPSNEVQHPVAHVDVVKAVDKDEAEYGDELLYTLTVTNPGAADLTGVVVSDPLPAGTTFVSASDGGTCDDPCTEVTWPARDLAAGESFEVTFTVTIDTPAAAADGAIPSAVILNSGAVDSNETPEEPSNVVRTVVTAVQGVKIVPPELPQTGSPYVPQTVLLAVGLLVAGAGMTFGQVGWRVALARAAAAKR